MDFTRNDNGAGRPAEADHSNFFPINVLILIEHFEVVEKLCETAITHQDEIGREIFRSGIDAQISNMCNEPQDQDGAACFKYGEKTFSSMSFSDFKNLNRLARDIAPGRLPNAMRRTVVYGNRSAFSQLEVLERQIEGYQFEMRELEQKILDEPPCSPAEAIAKLKFISSLILDGAEIDIDYFAYTVEECAYILNDMSRLAGPRWLESSGITSAQHIMAEKPTAFNAHPQA